MNLSNRIKLAACDVLVSSPKEYQMKRAFLNIMREAFPNVNDRIKFAEQMAINSKIASMRKNAAEVKEFRTGSGDETYTSEYIPGVSGFGDLPLQGPPLTFSLRGKGKYPNLPMLKERQKLNPRELQELLQRPLSEQEKQDEKQYNLAKFTPYFLREAERYKKHLKPEERIDWDNFQIHPLLLKILHKNRIQEQDKLDVIQGFLAKTFKPIEVEGVGKVPYLITKLKKGPNNELPTSYIAKAFNNYIYDFKRNKAKRRAVEPYRMEDPTVFHDAPDALDKKIDSDQSRSMDADKQLENFLTEKRYDVEKNIERLIDERALDAGLGYEEATSPEDIMQKDYLDSTLSEDPEAMQSLEVIMPDFNKMYKFMMDTVDSYVYFKDEDKDSLKNKLMRTTLKTLFKMSIFSQEMADAPRYDKRKTNYDDFAGFIDTLREYAIGKSEDPKDVQKFMNFIERNPSHLFSLMGGKITQSNIMRFVLYILNNNKDLVEEYTPEEVQQAKQLLSKDSAFKNIFVRLKSDLRKILIGASKKLGPGFWDTAVKYFTKEKFDPKFLEEKGQRSRSDKNISDFGEDLDKFWVFFGSDSGSRYNIFKPVIMSDSYLEKNPDGIQYETVSGFNSKLRNRIEKNLEEYTDYVKKVYPDLKDLPSMTDESSAKLDDLLKQKADVEQELKEVREKMVGAEKSFRSPETPKKFKKRYRTLLSTLTGQEKELVEDLQDIHAALDDVEKRSIQEYLDSLDYNSIFAEAMNELKERSIEDLDEKGIDTRRTNKGPEGGLKGLPFKSKEDAEAYLDAIVDIAVAKAPSVEKYFRDLNDFIQKRREDRKKIEEEDKSVDRDLEETGWEDTPDEVLPDEVVTDQDIEDAMDEEEFEFSTFDDDDDEEEFEFSTFEDEDEDEDF